MKIPTLLQIVFVSGNLLAAVPTFAATPGSAGFDAPVPQCGGEKGEKSTKDEKKSDKKDGKDAKGDSKAPASS
jgi:hypothetical protein